MLDPCSARTPAHLQLGEGVLLRSISWEDISAAADPAACLAQLLQAPAHRIGATKAGCEFRCVPTVLDTTRGSRTPASGETLIGRWEVTLSGTLLEISPENAAMLLNQSLTEADAALIRLEPQPTPVPVSSGDVCWLGDTGSGLLAIFMQCPVSIGGLVFRPRRDGLGEASFTLLAQKATPEQPGLPCKLLWLKEDHA